MASGTELTQRSSRPVLYELVSYRGEIFGPYPTMDAAAEAAKAKWPDQEQDEDRTGKGWDVQVCGLTVEPIWQPISLAPADEVVWTKIDDEDGERNVAQLLRQGKLWFVPDGSAYVYYTPTHWHR